MSGRETAPCTYPVQPLVSGLVHAFPVKLNLSAESFFFSRKLSPRAGQPQAWHAAPSHVSTDVMVPSPHAPARRVTVLSPREGWLSQVRAPSLPRHGCDPAPSCRVTIIRQVCVFTLCTRCFCWFLHSSRSAWSISCLAWYLGKNMCVRGFCLYCFI